MNLTWRKGPGLGLLLLAAIPLVACGKSKEERYAMGKNAICERGRSIFIQEMEVDAWLNCNPPADMQAPGKLDNYPAINDACQSPDVKTGDAAGGAVSLLCNTCESVDEGEKCKLGHPNGGKNPGELPTYITKYDDYTLRVNWTFNRKITERRKLAKIKGLPDPSPKLKEGEAKHEVVKTIVKMFSVIDMEVTDVTVNSLEYKGTWGWNDILSENGYAKPNTFTCDDPIKKTIRRGVVEGLPRTECKGPDTKTQGENGRCTTGCNSKGLVIDIGSSCREGYKCPRSLGDACSPRPPAPNQWTYQTHECVKK